ncbi:MAG TPA: hypothetical protein VMZ71_16480, partial [Gemmataceae bacterium]|nr:hypothetical protein [Gemmataceae bacterium]
MTAYLIQYGTLGFVGRFRASCAPLERDRRVVVQTPRGAEIGVVLCEPAERFSNQPADGDLLRPTSDTDETRASELARLAARVLDEAQQSPLPLAFVDAESTLDGIVILHALPWGECDATPLLD